MNTKTVNVPESALKDYGLARGWYAAYVVENGHEPGVLSGAELKGKAGQYRGSYDRRRALVVTMMQAFGVESRVVLHPNRRRMVRVWVDGATFVDQDTYTPVRVLLVSEAEAITTKRRVHGH